MPENFYDILSICLLALGVCCLVWVLSDEGDSRR